MVKLVKEGAASKRRKSLRREYWPDHRAWDGPDENGWFAAPRTLPFVLTAMKAKRVSGTQDPATVYLELLSRHMGDGIIEMGHEEDHANAAGYFGTRAVRTWKDRMRILERAGFIKCGKKGSREFAYVLLVHPALPMQALHKAGKIGDELWTAYRSRLIDAKEASYDDLVAHGQRAG